MTNYTKTTDFAAKDSLPSGNAAKIVKGSEIDTEFNNIATASATKANKNNAALTGTTTFETISDGTIAITGFVDEDNMVSDSAALLPTQQSVKAYVDSQVTAQDLDFQADTGGALSIDLDSESLTFTGGTGIDTSGLGNAVTFAIDSTVATLTGTQTLSNKTLSAPAVSGNLTTDGLIDGRDVATDGTKLDGIESGATADQTAAEIKTAYESNANTNAFTDADESKLDGIEALADVTDTANVTAAGALMDSELTSEASVKALNQGVATTDSPTFAGLTTAGLTLGATAITATGTELNYVDGVTSAIQTQLDSKAPTANPTFTGSFTSPGIDDNADAIAITIDSSENVGIGTSSPSGLMSFAKGSRTLDLKLEDTAATGDVGVQLRAGSGDYFGLAAGGGTGVGIVIDSSNNVGIGTTSPSGSLHVQSASSGGSASANADELILEGSGSTGLTILSGATDFGRIFFADSGDTADGFIQYDQSGRSMRFGTATAERLRIDSAGRVGIGTSSPGNLLEVSGASPIVEINSTSGVPELQFSDGGVDEFSIQYDTGANALKFVEGGVGTHVTIKDGGNVGIGTSNPTDNLSVGTLGSGSNSIITIGASTTGTSSIYFGDGASAARFRGYFDYVHSSDHLAIGTAATERMRIDSSGNLLVGASTFSFVGSSDCVQISGTEGRINIENDTTSTAYAVAFYNTNGLVGRISTSGSATAYVTSSDQRLKENIVDAPSASDDIDAIQVRSFDWKADGSHQKYGMVAQELQSVAPEAVSGDADSDEMMGVDYSKLVPMLVKEIQSLRNRVAQLENN